MEWNNKDRRFMDLALKLACKAHGDTSPNPLVGAVIVKDGVIIGKGYHHYAGAPHAEIEALRKVKTDPGGATLYVNLEPCCFQGKTPPCTTAIIESGVKKVVIATPDPNPGVAGKGLASLQAAGIETAVGLHENKAKKLNEVFMKFIQTNFPFVILKSALSLDGKIATATGKSKWITSVEARTDGHLLRRAVDAVLVGIDTVLADNPDLRVRHVSLPRKQPHRIVLDTHLRIPLSTQLVTSSKKKRGPKSASTIVVASDKAPRYKVEALRKKDVRCILVPVDHKGHLSLKQVFSLLAQQGITSVLIEGGPTVAASAFQENVVDKVVYYIAPKIIGGQAAPGPVGGKGVDSPEQAPVLQNIHIEQLGTYIKIQGYLNQEQ